MVTVVQQQSIRIALGGDVLSVAQQIDTLLESGLTVPGYLWTELLAALNAGSPDLMETPFGRAFTYLVQEKISNGNDDASLRRRRKPSLGYAGGQRE